MTVGRRSKRARIRSPRRATRWRAGSMGGALVLELAKRSRALSVVALAPGGGWAPDSGEADRLARLFTRQRQLARAFAPVVPRVVRSPMVRRLALRDVVHRGELVPPAD